MASQPIGLRLKAEFRGTRCYVARDVNRKGLLFRLCSGDEEATVHYFLGITGGLRVDFVAHSEGLETVDSQIVRTNVDGRYPSDHYPVTGALCWTDDASGTACSGNPEERL